MGYGSRPPSPPQQVGLQPHLNPAGVPLPPPHQPPQLKLSPSHHGTTGDGDVGTSPILSASPLVIQPLNSLPPPMLLTDVVHGNVGKAEGSYVGAGVARENAYTRTDLDSFPPGYRFNPRDDELIVHYLGNRILERPLPANKIHDVELYDYNPRQLAATYENWGEGKWYFFTSRQRKYRNGSRPKRSAGDGYWKATGADKPVLSEGIRVGVRKALVFYKGKPPKGEKTNWIMHEFRIIDSNGPRKYEGTMKLDECVLCSIHEKAPHNDRPRGRHGGTESRRVPSKQCEDGRKRKRLSKKEAMPALPTVRNSIDIGETLMPQASVCNNNDHQYSNDSMDCPQLDSINQHGVQETRFLQEAFPNCNGYPLGNQSLGDAMDSSVSDCWPRVNYQLEYAAQSKLTDPILDGRGQWVDGAGDFNAWDFSCANTNIGTIDVSPNPSDDYKLLANHSFGLDAVLPTTNAVDSSDYFPYGRISTDEVPKNTATLKIDITPETGAISETCGIGTCGSCASCETIAENFASSVLVSNPDVFDSKIGFPDSEQLQKLRALLGSLAKP